MGSQTKPSCVNCSQMCCYFLLEEKLPENCPGVKKAEKTRQSRKLLGDPGILGISCESSRVEGAGYGRWTRVEETVRFARQMDFKKIGIAFCIGLQREARAFADVLKAHGFDVVSVCCKVGGEPKERLGLEDSEKVNPGTPEAYCNPIAQALILDDEGCDLNVLVGLCVGHDSLFLKYAQTLTTVLIAKDRVTGNNPAAALYTLDSYYARLRYPQS